MSYDNLSSVSQNVLKFYQQLTGHVTSNEVSSDLPRRDISVKGSN
jgi:hypothetical protein